MPDYSAYHAHWVDTPHTNARNVPVHCCCMCETYIVYPHGHAPLRCPSCKCLMDEPAVYDDEVY